MNSPTVTHNLPRLYVGVLLVCVACGGGLGGERAVAAQSLVVTTMVDEDNGTSDPAFGAGTSLREAINWANTDNLNSAITFSLPLFAAPRKTITLNGTQLTLLNNGIVSITAPAAGVEISGNNVSRVFLVFSGANATLKGLTIRNGNAAGDNGGGVYNFGGTLLLDSCTFTDNTAAFGGGVFSFTTLSGLTTSIANCTFSGNTATTSGGGFLNFDGVSFLDSCTIAGNTAPLGAGVASYGFSNAQTGVRNSIISGNTGPDVSFVTGTGINVFTSTGFNLIGSGNATAFFNQTGDVTGNSTPGLAALADNGGPTQTRALVVSSPARNTGNTALTVDQRGVARPFGPADDKGAFEYVFNESLVVTTLADENDGTSDPAFGTGTSLREAIIRANSDGVNSAITFDTNVFTAPRATITLGGTQLTLANNGTLTITAPPAGVVIDGNNGSRVFVVDSGADVTLAGLSIYRGSGVGAPTGLAGGGIYNSGTLLLDSCTLFFNRADHSGGAIYSRTTLGGVTLTIRNCTLAGNRAEFVGNAIVNAVGLMIIESSTIASNGFAPQGPGAVFSENATDTRTEVRNSIISGNANTDVDSPLVVFPNPHTNSFKSNGYNLIGDGNATDAFNQASDVTGNSDPGLEFLADNGGPTATMALLFSSPARDTGNTALTKDQRGIARPQPAGYPADKGAFEFTPTESLVVTTPADEDNGTSDPRYGAGTSLREAINRANSDGVNSAITFDPVAFAAPRKTITLNGTQLPNIVEANSLAITAPAAGVEISGNSSSRIFSVNSDAVVTLEGLTLRDGRVVSPNNGGAILCRGRLVADACTFIGNQAYDGGAILLDKGGAVMFDDASLTLRNCTLSGNRAERRGNAVCNIRGLAIIESSTVTGNTGFASSAIWTGETPSDESTRFHNSIVAGNGNTDIDWSGSTPVFIDGVWVDIIMVSDGFNLIGVTRSSSIFNRPGDAVIGNGSPGLGPLQNNGGRTPTCAVLLGSSALNTGSSTNGTDQRGLARAFGATADKGAYELQPESYAFWSDYRFPSGTLAPARAPEADFDGDGIPNGMEQATGRNPLIPDAPGGIVTPYGIQGTNFVVRFERSVLVDPTKLFLEQSLYLAPASWTTLDTPLQNLGPATPVTELIQALIPIDSAPQKFGRLGYAP